VRESDAKKCRIPRLAFARGSLESAILKAHPHYTSVQLHTAENVHTSILVIGALIAVGAWLWKDLLISPRAARDAVTLIVGLARWLVGLGRSE
jgi:hypothetical protein